MWSMSRSVPVLLAATLALAGCNSRPESLDSLSSSATPLAAGPNQVVLEVPGMT